MQTAHEQVAAIADFLESTGQRFGRHCFLDGNAKKSYPTRRENLAELINDVIPNLRGARVPGLLPVGCDGLCVEFDFSPGKVLTGNCVDLFVYPIDFTLKDRDAAEYEILVLLSVGIAGLVNVQQVHLPVKSRERKIARRA